MNILKKIAIVTDTNSGMLPHESEEQGIFVLPMPFIIDNVCQLESVDISREEFYHKLISGSTVSTSQPSIGDLTDFWRTILNDYDEIVHVPTSSLLSNSYATAKAQAETEEFKGKVFCVDNHRISISLKSSVYDAVALRDQGKTATEIVEILETQAKDYSVYFSLESLEYLKKGGRISPAVATIGMMLKLRPVLRLQGEALEKYNMPRSLLKAKMIMSDAIKADLNGKFKEYTDKGEMRLAVVHAENETEAQAYKAELEKLFPNVPVIWCDPMSLSIACHVGPGTLAVACFRVNH